MGRGTLPDDLGDENIVVQSNHENKAEREREREIDPTSK